MNKLVLEGGKRVRKLRPSHRSWTKAKETRRSSRRWRRCCNVKLAAKRLGVSTSQAYVRRNKDARFRAGWDRRSVPAMRSWKWCCWSERSRRRKDDHRPGRNEDGDARNIRPGRRWRCSECIARMPPTQHETGQDDEYEEARERIFERLRAFEGAEADRDEAAPDASTLIALGAWGSGEAARRWPMQAAGEDARTKSGGMARPSACRSICWRLTPSSSCGLNGGNCRPRARAGACG